jgi:DNA-binding IclR family transcriptional regulator
MLSILSWFSAQHPRGGVKEIAEDLHLAPSTVRRLINTLKDHRYVELDEISGMYQLHVEVVRLAAVAITTNDVVRAASPIVDSLLQELDETLVLATLDGSLVVHLIVRQSMHHYSISPPIGRRYNSYEGGASGMALLAWKDPAELESILPDAPAWPVYAQQSTISRRQFLDALADVRLKGAAVNDGNTDPDMWSVAAPIRDNTGDVVASLSAACRRSRMTPERKAQFFASLVEASARISKMLCFDERTVMTPGAGNEQVG